MLALARVTQRGNRAEKIVFEPEDYRLYKDWLAELWLPASHQHDLGRPDCCGAGAAVFHHRRPGAARRGDELPLSAARRIQPGRQTPRWARAGVLAAAGITPQVGAAWTTDAPFRETAEAIAAARERESWRSKWRRRRSTLSPPRGSSRCSASRMSPTRWDGSRAISRKASRWRGGVVERDLAGGASLARAGAAMTIYGRWVFPPLLDLAMRQRQIETYRRQLIPAARGRVPRSASARA